MQLFHSHFSPFARKVMACAHELNLVDRIALLPSAAHPTKRDEAILSRHPLAQVPTLIDDGGRAIADSRVICEYLDALAGGRLFPPSGPARWAALSDQSTADGLLDAALLIRYELTTRPDSERSQAWIDGQTGKIESALQAFEADAASLHDRLDVGVIAIACALGYLDLRFPDLSWGDRFPALRAWADGFNRRPSMIATAPPSA